MPFATKCCLIDYLVLNAIFITIQLVFFLAVSFYWWKKSDCYFLCAYILELNGHNTCDFILFYTWLCK